MARLEAKIPRPEGGPAAPGAGWRPGQAVTAARDAARMDAVEEWLRAVRENVARLAGGTGAAAATAATARGAARLERQWQEARTVWSRGGSHLDRADERAATAYIAHHRDQARARAWTMILDDLGIAAAAGPRRRRGRRGRWRGVPGDGPG